MYFAFVVEKWVVGRGLCMLEQMDIPGLVFNYLIYSKLERVAQLIAYQLVVPKIQAQPCLGQICMNKLYELCQFNVNVNRRMSLSIFPLPSVTPGTCRCHRAPGANQ